MSTRLPIPIHAAILYHRQCDDTVVRVVRTEIDLRRALPVEPTPVGQLSERSSWSAPQKLIQVES